MKHKRTLFITALLVTLTTTIISISAQEVKYSKKHEKLNNYTAYVVEQGETLWSIAKKTSPGVDPREVVYEIRKVNGITPLIQPGQEILIPKINN